MIGIQASPGFWSDSYYCKSDNIIEAINRMLKLHAPDFPNTACGGFDIEYLGEIVKITPVVLRNFV